MGYLIVDNGTYLCHYLSGTHLCQTKDGRIDVFMDQRKKKTKVVCVRLDDKLFNACSRLAANRDWTVAHVVRYILLSFFDFYGDPPRSRVLDLLISPSDQEVPE